uniref:Uncharacterized protein n=1 Tax=Arundo donax TaxID=35708 RepID=A0A0A8ZSZ2_ARUDO
MLSCFYSCKHRFRQLLSTMQPILIELAGIQILLIQTNMCISDY